VHAYLVPLSRLGHSEYTHDHVFIDDDALAFLSRYPTPVRVHDSCATRSQSRPFGARTSDGDHLFRLETTSHRFNRWRPPGPIGDRPVVSRPAHAREETEEEPLTRLGPQGTAPLGQPPASR
jgi:hypothetical protein